MAFCVFLISRTCVAMYSLRHPQRRLRQPARRRAQSAGISPHFAALPSFVWSVTATNTRSTYSKGMPQKRNLLHVFVIPKNISRPQLNQQTPLQGALVTQRQHERYISPPKSVTTKWGKFYSLANTMIPSPSKTQCSTNQALTSRYMHSILLILLHMLLSFARLATSLAHT